MLVSPAFHTDQADTILHKVSVEISRRHAKSMLDIGAGPAATAVQLARSVDRYVAVEQDPGRAVALRAAGLSVVDARFPCSLGKLFDVVLSSHSLPDPTSDSMASFLDGAWSCVAPHGILLLVTFIGCESELYFPRAQLMGARGDHSLRITLLLDALRNYGSVMRQTFDSFVWSTSIDDMVSYLNATIFFDSLASEPAEKSFSIWSH